MEDAMRTRHDATSQDVAELTRILHGLAWNMPPESQQRLKDRLIAEVRSAEPSRSTVPGGWRVTSPGRQLRRRVWPMLGAGAAAPVIAPPLPPAPPLSHPPSPPPP